MNILILNGSPRKNGNTKFMIDAFIKGAKKSNDITEVPVCERKIGGCLACEYYPERRYAGNISSYTEGGNDNTGISCILS